MIKDQIKKDLLHARKDRNGSKITVTSLSTLLGEIERVDANKLTVAMEIGVIKKYLVSLYNAAHTSDLANQEYQLILDYLPKQLSEDDINKVLAELPDKVLKVVMPYFKTNFEGLYDATLVAKLVQKHAV